MLHKYDGLLRNDSTNEYSNPLLMENQEIEAWKPLFIAATITLVATLGEKMAIQNYLPIY